MKIATIFTNKPVKLSLFLTYQYIKQINEKIKAVIFGKFRTLISFRVGTKDVKHHAKEFHPPFDKNDFVNLPRYSKYIKLMIDGATSQPFSAQTIASHKIFKSLKNEIISHSRLKYGNEKETVDKTIFEKYEKVQPEHNEVSLFD